MEEKTTYSSMIAVIARIVLKLRDHLSRLIVAQRGVGALIFQNPSKPDVKGSQSMSFKQANLDLPA